MSDWTRRRVLKGMLHGGAVTIGLPFLDLHLDGNGEALAAGAPIPTRFGTWLWGCGINQDRFYPDKFGAGYDVANKPELAAIGPYRDKVTVFSGFNTILAGRPNLSHYSGIMGTLTGTAPSKTGPAEAPTIDIIVANTIGTSSRFKSLEVCCSGDPNVSFSRQEATINPSEVDPVNLYKRIFGPEYKDPNAAEFKPDPDVMLRQSVLSSIKDQRDTLNRKIGAADRARLDQYFTSVRQLEGQLEGMLQKPAPAEACVVGKEAAKMDLGPTWESATKTHEVMVPLLVMALACNQTRVFNVILSRLDSNLRRSGEAIALHELTHNEIVDDKLKYQPKSTFFLEHTMEMFASLIKAMNETKEGNGTLLDHSLIMATSESNFAKFHTLDSIPVLVAGTAGGKWKSGQHIAGKGDGTSRIGLTIQQVLGVSVSSWGSAAMETSKPIIEVMA